MSNYQYWTAICIAMPAMSPIIALLVQHLARAPFRQCFQAALVMGLIMGGLLWLYIQAALPLNGIPLDAKAFGGGNV